MTVRSPGKSKPPVSTTRLLAVVVGAAITAPCVAVSLAAFGVPFSIAWATAIMSVGFGAAVANAKAPADLANLTSHSRLVFALWLGLSAGAVCEISSLALFVDNVSKTQHAFQRDPRKLDNPELTEPFFVKHNCSTCYIVAVHLARSGIANIYDKKYYRSVEERTPVHDTIGDAFNIDQFQYPPPFLLGPYLAYSVGLDFFQIRSLWFAFSVLLFVATTGALTVWIVGWRFSPLWLMWPALFLAPVTIATLQMGNVHAFMLLISILAMVLFENRHNALGGVLLAYATLSKFFPGFLIVYLLFRRNWKACMWTVAASVALCGITLIVFGATPYKAFFDYQLPGIASGAAFPFAFTKANAVLSNSALAAIPIKLDALGMLPSGWDPVSVARIVSWIYTLVVVAVAAIMGMRHGPACADDDSSTAEVKLWMARVWVALIVLAQLRSPFLPATYGNIAILMLLGLLLPWDRVTLPRVMILGLGFLAFGLVVPLPFGPANSAFDFVFVIGTILLALLGSVILAVRPRPADRESSSAETFEHKNS